MLLACVFGPCEVVCFSLNLLTTGTPSTCGPLRLPGPVSGLRDRRPICHAARKHHRHQFRPSLALGPVWQGRDPETVPARPHISPPRQDVEDTSRLAPPCLHGRYSPESRVFSKCISVVGGSRAFYRLGHARTRRRPARSGRKSVSTHHRSYSLHCAAGLGLGSAAANWLAWPLTWIFRGSGTSPPKPEILVYTALAAALAKPHSLNVQSILQVCRRGAAVALAVSTHQSSAGQWHLRAGPVTRCSNGFTEPVIRKFCSVAVICVFLLSVSAGNVGSTRLQLNVKRLFCVERHHQWSETFVGDREIHRAPQTARTEPEKCSSNEISPKKKKPNKKSPLQFHSRRHSINF